MMRAKTGALDEVNSIFPDDENDDDEYDEYDGDDENEDNKANISYILNRKKMMLSHI